MNYTPEEMVIEDLKRFSKDLKAHENYDCVAVPKLLWVRIEELLLLYKNEKRKGKWVVVKPGEVVDK